MGESLTQLYNEKKLLNPKMLVKPKKPKKIKKKDIIIEHISLRELQYYEYTTFHDIDIYNGVLISNKDEILNNIEFFKQITDGTVFTPLIPSTLTAKGEFTNTNFIETDFIHSLDIPPIEYLAILKIACNFGEIYSFPNPFINHTIETMVKSIIALDGKNIKIGCNCNPNVLDINAILEESKKINIDTDIFLDLLKTCIKDKLVLEKKHTTSVALKIMKDFYMILSYKLPELDDIKGLYNIIEMYIPKASISLCSTYIDNIIKIVNHFTAYEKKCTCVNKFRTDNNLLHLDRDSLVKQKKNSTRGRKPKDKKKAKRKIQGTGLHFSSQISFNIYNYHNNNITKIKLFRNGEYQIPGVKRPDMSDVFDSILLLKNYLNYVKDKEYQNTDLDTPIVKIPYLISVMRNYICRIADPNIMLKLNSLKDILYFEKGMSIPQIPFKEFTTFLDTFQLSNEMRYKVFRYCNVGFYKISEIAYDNEKYQGILVKFLRPIPNKEQKKITVKILSSGKINQDGCTSEIEVYEIYYWMQYIFRKYWDEITYDIVNKIDDPISSDTEEYDYIYDDE